MKEFIIFLVVAIRAYRGAKNMRHKGHSYSAYTVGGVPQIVVFCGIGREAWRVSQRAIEEYRATETS